MNLIQVEYFLELARKLNFTAAAKSLYISQPALSMQISKLEEELDIKLFIRDKKKIKLTKAGEQFQYDLEKTINKLEEAKINAIQIGKKEKKEIVIGCFDGAIFSDFLPNIIKRIDEKIFDAQVTIQRNSFKEIRDALKNDEVDILFTLDFDISEFHLYDTKRIITRKGNFIFSDKLSLAKKKDLKLEDFKNEIIIVIDPKNSYGGYIRTINTLNEIGIDNPKIKKVNSMIDLLTYVEMGYGVAILDGEIADQRKGFFKFELPSCANIDIMAVWKKENAFIESVMGDYK